MAIDRDTTLSSLSELIRIDSRNPDLEAGAPGEERIARHVAGLLAQIGWSAEVHDLGNHRANVVAVHRGTGGGPSLMINAHLDTVGVAGMADPFSGALRDGRIHGRGSQDTKGGVAAVLAAARSLSESGARLRGDLVLTFVADEESGSIGTADAVRRHRTDAGIVIEPTDLDVCVAHRGFGIFRLATRGITAHGGRADLGLDANLHMGHALVALDRIRETWHARPPHPLLGTGTLHVPLVAGGRQRFIYADRCTADVECRTVPGQTAGSVQDDLQAALASVADRVDRFDGTVEPVMWRAPWQIDAGRPIVRTVVQAATAVRQSPPQLIGHGWWEDSALLGEAGIEAVVLGPRGGGLHTEQEWVDADSVIDLAEILRRSILLHCGEA
jgi:acetylornithine deacetylase